MTTNPSFAQTADHEAAKVPLDAYLQAHRSGDAAPMRRAFSADARIVGHVGGQLVSWSVEQYAGRFSGKPAADEAQRQRSYELLDLSGDAAIAKVVLDYPSVRFVDHMALLRIDGEWKIVSKTFYAQPRPAAAR